jgi:ubiquinone/menaquinone biosynthesis C-methylase UbiE
MAGQTHRFAPNSHLHGDGPGGTPRLHNLLAPLIFAGRRRRFRKLTALSGVRGGERILDVGCGTGHLTRMVARAAGPDGSALGVDPSSEALARARRATRVANCAFGEGRAEKLDFPDGSFDAVVSSLMIHHLPDDQRTQAIGEMSRVLRPGGRVLVADFRPPASPWLRRVVHLVVSHAMEHNPVQMLDSMVANAGFEDVSAGDIPPWIHYVTAAKPA